MSDQDSQMGDLEASQSQLAKHDSFTEIAAVTAHSALFTAFQEPVNGFAQAMDKLADTSFLPKVQLLDAPEKTQFGSKEWFAQQVGGAVGTLVPFTLARTVLRFGSGSLSAEAASTPSALTSTMRVKEAGMTGFVYEGLFRPTDSSQSESGLEFLSHRFNQGLIGASTFMTLSSASLGLNRLAEATPIKGSLLAPILKSPITGGIISGVPAGLISAELNSINRSGHLAANTDLAQSVLGMSITGGGFGVLHTLYAPRTADPSRFNKAEPVESKVHATTEGADVATVKGDSNPVTPKRKIDIPNVENARHQDLIEGAQILNSVLKADLAASTANGLALAAEANAKQSNKSYDLDAAVEARRVLEAAKLEREQQRNYFTTYIDEKGAGLQLHLEAVAKQLRDPARALAIVNEEFSAKEIGPLLSSTVKYAGDRMNTEPSQVRVSDQVLLALSGKVEGPVWHCAFDPENIAIEQRRGVADLLQDYSLMRTELRSWFTDQMIILADKWSASEATVSDKAAAVGHGKFANDDSTVGSFQQRQADLQQLLDTLCEKAAIPKVRLIAVPVPAERFPAALYQSGVIRARQQILEELPPEQLGALIFHETLHSEQEFLEARKVADDLGLTDSSPASVNELQREYRTQVGIELPENHVEQILKMRDRVPLNSEEYSAAQNLMQSRRYYKTNRSDPLAFSQSESLITSINELIEKLDPQVRNWEERLSASDIGQMSHGNIKQEALQASIDRSLIQMRAGDSEALVRLLEDTIVRLNSWRKMAAVDYAAPKLEWDAQWAEAFIEKEILERLIIASRHQVLDKGSP